MISKADILLSVLVSSVALGGLLLVFIGFVGKGESPQANRLNLHGLAARIALVPFSISILDGILCAICLNGFSALYGLVLALFYLSLLSVLIYGIAVVLLFL
ncbi:MAG TPA: hypothetical protein VFY29_20075 [Terriglobia bacterium]|nr:hypothetical protein [Terriglobia bacterium]